MVQERTIQLRAATAGMEKGKFVVRIKVKNSGDRTLYAYGSPRRTQYDNATGKLTLYLHDQHLSPEEEKILSPHLQQPTFVPLEAGVETEIFIALSPTLNRLRSAAERGTGPLFEQLRVSEAKEVEVEIAYHDTPFYYNPKIANATQLKEWGKQIAKANFKIKKEENRKGK